jgi:hypothetical protein
MIPLTITRAVLVILIPGLLTLAPWVLWSVLHYENMSVLYKNYSTLFNVTIIISAIIIGSVIEGLTSRLEVRWDEEREEKYNVDENWYDYLAQQCMAEPVGFKYISSMFNMLYFELSMMVASPIALVGFAFLVYKYITASYAIMCGLLAIVSVIFFFKQAKDSHRVLCKARKEINIRMKQSGP